MPGQDEISIDKRLGELLDIHPACDAANTTQPSQLTWPGHHFIIISNLYLMLKSAAHMVSLTTALLSLICQPGTLNLLPLNIPIGTLKVSTLLTSIAISVPRLCSLTSRLTRRVSHTIRNYGDHNLRPSCTFENWSSSWWWTTDTQ